MKERCRFAFALIIIALLLPNLAFAQVNVAASDASYPTGYNENRRNFYDSVNRVYWACYTDNNQIKCSYSGDNSNWDVGGTFAVSSQQFDVLFSVIGGQPYAFFAISVSGLDDIRVIRATLTATTITQGSTQTVLSDADVTKRYWYPSIAISSAGNLWVAGVLIDTASGISTVAVKKSVNTAEGNIASWTSVASAFSAKSVTGLVLLPQANGRMFLAANTEADNLRTFYYTSGAWTENANHPSEDPAWSALSGFSPGAAIYALEMFGGTLYAGGNFTLADGSQNIARWSGSSWVGVGGGVNGGAVWAINGMSGTLLVGGVFTSVGSPAVPDTGAIAAWNGIQWSALGAGGGNGVFIISCPIPNQDRCYVGGDFTNMGGLEDADYFAYWNDTAWEAPTSGTDVLNGPVYGLAAVGSTVYVGGDFTNAGDIAEADRIAAWNVGTPGSWSALGTGSPGGRVLWVDYGYGNLYVAGIFSNLGGVPEADGVARWNGVAWEGLGSGLTGSALYVDNIGNEVYVSGNFTAAGGDPSIMYLARWDGVSWSNVAGAEPDLPVYSVIRSGSDIYAGGRFTAGFGQSSTTAVAKLSQPYAIDYIGRISAAVDPSYDVHMAYTNWRGEVIYKHFDSTSRTMDESVALSYASATAPQVGWLSNSDSAVVTWIWSGDMKGKRAQSPFDAQAWSGSAATIISSNAISYPKLSRTWPLSLFWVGSAAPAPYQLKASGLLNMSRASGTVLSPGGANPLSGVTVHLSGASVGSTTTDAEGSWSFSPLADGSYTFTPELSPYTFSPQQYERNISSDSSGMSFTAVEPTATPLPTSTALPTATPVPTPVPDTVAPVVSAKKSKGKAGKSVRLYYLVTEAGNASSEAITVKAKTGKKKTIKKLTVAMSAIPGNKKKSASFKSKTSQKGTYRFCVVSSDASGNKSAKACADVVIS